jgi:gp16 family phage-associated protein
MATPKAIRTPNDVKHWLRVEKHTTLKQWAKSNGYSYHNVAAVMCGRNKAAFGKGREIAEKLGLKVAA